MNEDCNSEGDGIENDGSNEDKCSGEENDWDSDEEETNTDKSTTEDSMYRPQDNGWESDQPNEDEDPNDKGSRELEVARALLYLNPLLKLHREILPPGVLGERQKSSTYRGTWTGVQGCSLILVRSQKLSGGNGVTNLEYAWVIVSGAGNNNSGTQTTEGKPWILKRYNPHRRGSGLEFAQKKLQGLLQINAERRAYACIASIPKDREGVEFLVWMGASLRLMPDSENEQLGILMVSRFSLTIRAFAQPRITNDLGRWLDKVPNSPRQETRRVMAQCIVGLATLHSIGIIHADMKPANVFLDGRLNVKIGDFGLSRFSIEQRPLKAKVAYGDERVGTEGYQAPEIYACPPRYSYQVDYWAGAVFMEMLVGNDEFLAALTQKRMASWAEKYQDIEQRRTFCLRQSSSLDEPELAVLCGLLDPIPMTRMGFDGLLLQKFFEKEDGCSEFQCMRKNALERPEITTDLTEQALYGSDIFSSDESSNGDEWAWINPRLFERCM